MFIVIAYRFNDGLGVGAKGNGEIQNHFILALNLWEHSSAITEAVKMWGRI